MNLDKNHQDENKVNNGAEGDGESNSPKHQNNDEKNNSTIYNNFEEIVNDKTIVSGAKAELFLRAATIAKIIKPDQYDKMFLLLKPYSSSLTTESHDEFNSLKEYYGVKNKIFKSKFALSFISEIETADKNSEGFKDVLSDLTSKLNKRWWTIGKKYLRYRLMEEMKLVDRTESLKYLKYFSENLSSEITKSLDQETPFNSHEWQTALSVNDSLRSVIFDKLDRKNFPINLNEIIVEKLCGFLLNDFFEPDKNDSELSYSQKALERYFFLAGMAYSFAPKKAGKLLEALYKKIIEHNYDDKWPQQFTLIRRLLNEAFEYTSIKDKLYEKMYETTEFPIKEFMISQWLALNSNTYNDAKLNLAKCLEKCIKNSDEVEAWFLITLVRQDKAELAVKLAKESSNQAKLKSRLTRAIVQCCSKELIKELLDKSDLIEDVVAILFSMTLPERIKYLRNLTQNGKHPLPKDIWKQPTLPPIDRESKDEENDNALMVTYTKIEKDENKFSEYLKMHGFGQYSYEDVDPVLFVTLAEWDNKFPGEVPNFIKKLWEVMEPDDEILKIDLIRNTIFSRCRKTFSACPEIFESTFIKYAKRKLVDDCLQWSYGDTSYTLRLPDTMPLQNLLICAESWGHRSSKKCDELVLKAMGNYTADEEWSRIAAAIYASDKGLKALCPPIQIEKHLIASWQIGVVQQSDNDIISLLVNSAS